MSDSAIGDRVVRLVALGAAVTVLVAVAFGASASAGATGAVGSNPSSVGALAPVSGYDAVVTRIDLDRDGDARWQVEFRYELTDRAARRAFARARTNVSNPPGVFVGRMRRAVDRAQRETGRSMAVENGSVRTHRSVPSGRFGVVTYRFTWTNFAATPASDRYVLGDAIGGLRLGANESLWMEWPDAFERASVTPDPDASQAHAVRWTGPVQFRTEDPTVALDATGVGGFDPVLPALGGVALALVLAVGWYGYGRWWGESATADDGPAGGTTAAPADAGGDETRARGSGTAEDSADDPPEELLTDEERVLGLLEAKGGRMKQQDLIAAVDWSRTKASDVVNEMHEAERIEVYRLGRENVLALPGEIEV
ncbi:hypothetical protein SAMN05216388_1004191 [Halorientalis persicus]|uniref:DUF4897 domain-containing protein n=1 Tax=Halorientalis persicus TaxID=1367881 RepID=A0A1H8IL99_9EURY|nr:hypothetical protein [Halorientalis persicus]SEN68895.1 hypothetical protein SAMN05216388_1004191 [Halorientalis persicus]